MGQRQRLALTRALCSTAPLVVMDEPTAHLDAASEAHVLDAVRALHASGRTVVVIAHRPALMALAEQTIAVTSQAVRRRTSHLTGHLPMRRQWRRRRPGEHGKHIDP